MRSDFSVVPNHPTVFNTWDEWIDYGIKLFGTLSLEHWKFRCPGCGNVQSLKTFNEHVTVGATSNSVAQECIGLWVREKACKRVSYGVFSGPVMVKSRGLAKADDEYMYVFEFDIPTVKKTPKQQGFFNESIKEKSSQKDDQEKETSNEKEGDQKGDQESIGQGKDH